MKLKALKDGFDGFKRIRGPKADGSADGEVFEHTRITLEKRTVMVGSGDKAKPVVKFVMPAWCEVVNDKDRDKFIYQGDRALKIQENLERMSKEAGTGSVTTVDKKSEAVVTSEKATKLFGSEGASEENPPTE